VNGSLTQALARKMIRQLTAGTTPLEGVRFLNVGRERYYHEVERMLDDIAEGGGASIRFLNADYGHGKTHFIGMVNTLALDRNWVTSYVKLSAAEGIRLDRFEQLYAGILRNCLCRGLIEEHQQLYDPGDANGWPWILNNWIRRHIRVEANTGIDPNSMGARDRTLSALDLLLRKANVSGDFASAVRIYTNAALDRASDEDRKLQEAVIRWFACENIPELKQHGILAPITSKNAKQTLRCVIALLREFGYGGMAIFIDEAENAQDYTRPQRRLAYQNLRELLDNVDGGVSGVGLSRAICYVAATPVMFTGEKGFREYPALQDRIEDVKIDIRALQGLIDYRAIVTDLSLSPLTGVNRWEIARKIRDIHGIAFRWTPEQVVTNDWLDSLTKNFEKRMGEYGGLRPLCKSVAKALEIAEQHPDAMARVNSVDLISAAFAEEGKS
jgi:hypothetical protein